MDTFSTIRVKTEVAEKFRAFSKNVAPTHSLALQIMISFFIENGISPLEDCGPHFKRLEKNILKRINTVIGFLKVMEQEQLKPTLGILMALLEENSLDKTPKFQERKLLLEKTVVMSNESNINQIESENERLRLQIIENQEILKKLLANEGK